MRPLHRDELERWIEDGRDFALIEVLPPEKFDEFHLPGAINVPIGQPEFGAAIQRAVPDKSKPVVVYCQDLKCTASPKAAEQMDRLGYRQVYDYEAGKADWRDAGLPIEGTSATGLEVFDQTLQKTNIWLKEIMDDLGPDRQRAYHALRAVLHTLRDRLTVEEAAHLSAQLPLLVRGIYFEGWHPAHKPTTERSREDFLEQVNARLQGFEPINPEAATRSVFKVLSANITETELAHVRDMLPKRIQTFFS